MRVNNSIRNVFVALMGQGIGIILSFIGRVIFIRTLGTEYLGINGLFTNILSMLSLAEMGLGTAIIYSLYKPLANKDLKEVKALMRFYEVAYRIIGIVIFILGVSLIPFLDYIIKDKPNISNLTYIYILFLLNTVFSYFFAYKRSLIIADQKSYITTIYRYGFFILLNILQIVVLLITKSFIIFLFIQIGITIIENLAVARKADKMYPFLVKKDNEKLNIDSRREIFKNIKAMMCHRIGGVVVTGTDNILISSFVGVAWVGLYSNYYLIINALNIIIGQSFNSITASIGNLNASETKEKSYKIYKCILFMNFWIAGFATISLLILLNPFISLWIGINYIFESNLVLIIIINFYILTVRKTTLVYRDAFGLFWYDRYKPLVESIINIIVSVLLAPKLGIAGVFIGTFISTMTTSFWVEPYVLYKYGFELNVRDYFNRCTKYTIVIIIAAVVTNIVCSGFKTITWISILGRASICIIIPNIIFLICFKRSDEFKYLKNLIKSLINNKLNK